MTTTAKFINIQEADALNKAAVSFAARQYSSICKTHYSNLLCNAANTIRDLLDSAYYNTATYITYRKTFIAIKVANTAIKNKQLVNSITELCEEKHYQLINTPQGIIIRIPQIK